MKRIYCFPNMIGLGAYYANNLNSKYLRKSSRKFIQGEIKRIADLNFMLAEILQTEKPRESWAIELETHILRQMFSENELNLMDGEQKRSALVRLLFPKE
ncbi:MAG: hypothetical protein KBD76_04585 [Bacteriovorax sp.]|nr:hypothetical protein [Bacteriovorax sp.]